MTEMIPSADMRMSEMTAERRPLNETCDEMFAARARDFDGSPLVGGRVIGGWGGLCEAWIQEE